jgi:hypothetical protein
MVFNMHAFEACKEGRAASCQEKRTISKDFVGYSYNVRLLYALLGGAFMVHVCPSLIIAFFLQKLDQLPVPQSYLALPLCIEYLPTKGIFL